MVARKTQKKHLGKKRKSLSKRKAHSKKKRHSKQRTTKKRSHKGGGGGDPVYNPLFGSVNPEVDPNANEIAENIEEDKKADAEKKAKEKAAKKAKEWQKRLENYILDEYPKEENEGAMYFAPDQSSIQTHLINCIMGEKPPWSELYVDEKWIKKVVDFIEMEIIPIIEKAPYNNDFKTDQLKCINKLLNRINTDLEYYYIFNLKYKYISNCPDEALKERIINCIIKCIDKNKNEDEVEITNNFSYNDSMEAFVNELIAKIENDEETKYVPNKELKNKLIDCVRYATQEGPPDDPCIAELPG